MNDEMSDAIARADHYERKFEETLSKYDALREICNKVAHQYDVMKQQLDNICAASPDLKLFQWIDGMHNIIHVTSRGGCTPKEVTAANIAWRRLNALSRAMKPGRYSAAHAPVRDVINDLMVKSVAADSARAIKEARAIKRAAKKAAAQP